MKRIFLFVATNIAVLFVLSISASILIRVLGIQEMPGGLNLQSLVIFAAVIGFGGSFISLAMSKWMAKRATGATVIEQPRNSTEQWLFDTVRRLAKQAGIGMPEVAVYEASDVNAFATGMRRDSALVAVSTGLLNAMDKDEAEAVLGHEITHVSNGDMVTLALIQGVLNTFVIVLSRVVGYFVDRVLLKNDRDSGGIGFFVSSLVAQIVLGVLASMIVMWFSRQREFRADAGGAKLAGRDKMIAALERLKAMHEPAQLPDQMAAFGISGAPAGGFKRLFMSHPPLDERIAALKQAR
ncbi:protease HtpX [Sulfuricaulis sp.]|jgi:heat shock protein HtpX|uniref:protease HtpX n=1 Tax=Sulfuricaulis sp. TaxID=2003553 RepID=UPI00355A55C7